MESARSSVKNMAHLKTNPDLILEEDMLSILDSYKEDHEIEPR